VKDLNVLDLEISAECVLKPLRVQLLLAFCVVCLWSCFAVLRKVQAYTAEYTGTTCRLLWAA